MKKILKCAILICAAVFVGCRTEKKQNVSEQKTQKSEASKSNAENQQKSKNSAAILSKEIVPGGKIEETHGFFDIAGGNYPENVIVIDDAHFSDAKAKRLAFTNAAASGSTDSPKLTETPALILLSGTVDLSDGAVSDEDHSYFDEFDPESHKKINADFVFDIGSNKTIIGVDSAKIAYGGLRIKARPTNTAKNIVIRNIVFWDAHGSTDYDTSVEEFKDKKASADQISIEGSYAKGEYLTEFIPENIWIDHCSFSDGICVDLDRNFNHDGSLDAKAVHNMTVSWCEFTNHDKVTLVGASDSFTESKDRQITFHHNFYHGTVQRMPRARGCQIHIYNNLYENIGTDNNGGYSLGPGVGSLFVVENNIFGAHKSKILKYFDKSESGEPTFSRVFASGNSPELDKDNAENFELHKVSEKPFDIQYKYTLDETSVFAEKIRSNAGATLKISVQKN